MRYSDLATPEFFADPYPTYDAMRMGGALVELAPGLFVTGRYSIADTLLLDRRLGKNIEASVSKRYGERGVEQPLFRVVRDMLIGMNPPKHTRLRSLLMKSFNARQIEAFRRTSLDISNRLVDSLLSAGEGDLVRDFAFLLPVQIICTMLDVPLDDAKLFLTAAEKVAASLDIHPLKPAELEFGNRAMLDLQQYFGTLLEARRRRPGQVWLAQSDRTRLPDMRLTGLDALRWRQHNVLRGVESLHVVWS